MCTYGLPKRTLMMDGARNPLVIIAFPDGMEIIGG